jgi:hypothetical protein
MTSLTGSKILNWMKVEVGLRKDKGKDIPVTGHGGP